MGWVVGDSMLDGGDRCNVAGVDYRVEMLNYFLDISLRLCYNGRK